MQGGAQTEEPEDPGVPTFTPPDVVDWAPDHLLVKFKTGTALKAGLKSATATQSVQVVPIPNGVDVEAAAEKYEANPGGQLLQGSCAGRPHPVYHCRQCTTASCTLPSPA